MARQGKPPKTKEPADTAKAPATAREEPSRSRTGKSIKKRRLEKKPTRRPLAILTGDEWREGLSEREAIFVEQYLVDLSPKRAAARAGYVPHIGNVLLKKVSICNAIDQALAKSANITRPRIVQELARIAFTNIGDYYDWDENGATVKSSRTLTDEQKSSICEIRQTNNSNGKVTSLSIRFADKLAALDKLARITKLLKTDSLEVTGLNGSPLVPEGASTRDIAEAVLGVLNATRPAPAAYMGDLKAIEVKDDT